LPEGALAFRQMREVTDETFEQEVLQAGGKVVVDFWAPWCGPCKAVESVLERLEAENDHAVFAKVNVDENPAFASRYGVLALPTTIVFEDGVPRETLVGARPRSDYQRALGI
jgi:thioredoxin 1